MKYSRQRERIYRAVAEHPCHPTADQVYAWLRQELPTLSLGTVYRNLNQLSQNGMLRKISLPGQSDRFDGRLCDHEHMVCEKCQAVYDIELDAMAGIRREIEERSGFRVTRCELMIRGVCPSCDLQRAEQSAAVN